jgi:hypothetical protein
VEAELKDDPIRALFVTLNDDAVNDVTFAEAELKLVFIKFVLVTDVRTAFVNNAFAIVTFEMNFELPLTIREAVVNDVIFAEAELIFVFTKFVVVTEVRIEFDNNAFAIVTFELNLELLLTLSVATVNDVIFANPELIFVLTKFVFVTEVSIEFVNNAFAIVTFELNLESPLTSNLYAGAVVDIPTLPFVVKIEPTVFVLPNALKLIDDKIVPEDTFC